MKKFMFFLAISLLILSCQAQTTGSLNHDIPLSEILDSQHIDKSSISILIDKSDYRLYVCCHEKVLKSYPVVFGKNTQDDKLMQGDNCTPEGSFRIITKYPHKSWSKFIWINYPNDDSWKKHNAAKSAGKIPANAQIGGEIGIHGVPAGMDHLVDLRYNWTLGCISLKNKDVNEIYPLISKTTKIEIRK